MGRCVGRYRRKKRVGSLLCVIRNTQYKHPGPRCQRSANRRSAQRAANTRENPRFTLSRWGEERSSDAQVASGCCCDLLGRLVDETAFFILHIHVTNRDHGPRIRVTLVGESAALEHLIRKRNRTFPRRRRNRGGPLPQLPPRHPRRSCRHSRRCL